MNIKRSLSSIKRMFDLKNFAAVAAFLTIALILVLSACTENAVTTVKIGRASLSLTDSPLEEDAITGVWITITSVDFHSIDGVLHTYAGNVTDQPINLMQYSGGQTIELGTEVALSAGEYDQIRFLLDISGDVGDETSNPGCFVTIDDDDDPLTDDIKVELSVPSGDTSGYKADGLFTVPIGGNISLAAEIDLRKSLLRVGIPSDPSYLLKPVFRLIVIDGAGWIHGPVVPSDVPAAAASIVAYAYTDGSWSAAEAADLDFENALTSDFVDFVDVDPSESSYTLAFLPAGVYDVAVAAFDVEGDLLEMWGFYNNAVVAAEQGMVVEISNANLSPVLE
jgi:hypothetical protein